MIAPDGTATQARKIFPSRELARLGKSALLNYFIQEQEKELEKEQRRIQQRTIEERQKIEKEESAWQKYRRTIDRILLTGTKRQREKAWAEFKKKEQQRLALRRTA